MGISASHSRITSFMKGRMAHAIKALLSHYDAAYTEKFGVRYPLNPGKDPALAKYLLSLYSVEQLCAWIDQFFESDDAFIQQSGYTFGVFRACLSKIITAHAQPLKVEPWQRKQLGLAWKK